uniref:Nucleoporin NDC1 n=1 Tax=Ditylenchus dipsaci TaxID=166011 RepID=A0A915E132_9BILA
MLELKDANPDVDTQTATFLQQKTSNRHKAALKMCIFSAFIFVWLACCLQFSLFKPITSILDNFGMLFSKMFLLMLALQTLLVYGQTFQLTKIFSVTYEPNLNLCKWQNFAAFSIYFVGNALTSLLFSLAIAEPVWMTYRSLSVLWILSTLISGVLSAYNTNFKLDVENISQFNQLPNSELIKNSLAQCIHKSVFVVGFAWPLSLVLAILFGSLRSSALQLFAFWKVFDVLLLMFSQQMLSKYAVGCINYYIGHLSGSITQGFPANSTSFGKQTGLLAALFCEDPQLQLHGLYRLLLLCSESAESRQHIYEVSWPGKHPRNWNYTRDICINYINQVKNKLEAATRSKSIKMTTTTTSSVSPAGAKCSPNSSASSLPPKEKELFFLPPNLNPRSKMVFAPAAEATKKAGTPLGTILLPQFVNNYLQRLKNILFIPPQLVSPFELQAATFSIKALGHALSHSLQEDEYGVVQKDLRSVISLLTTLSITIDAFVRSNEPGRMKSEPNIVQLDNILAETLTQINVTFGDHIKDLRLHPQEEEVLEVLAKSYLDPSITTTSTTLNNSSSKKWR